MTFEKLESASIRSVIKIVVLLGLSLICLNLHRWCTWCGMQSMTLSLATCKIIPRCPAAPSDASPSCTVPPSTR